MCASAADTTLAGSEKASFLWSAQVLREIGYEGATVVEHEPVMFDPTDDILAMSRASEIVAGRIVSFGAIIRVSVDQL